MIRPLAQQGNLPALLKLLLSSTHHGRPGAPLHAKRLVVREVLRSFHRNLDGLWEWTEKFARHSERTARQLALGWLGRFWKPSPSAVERYARELAEDEDWEVREAAAGLFAKLLGQDWDRVYPLFKRWARSGSARLKRAVALSLKSNYGARHAEDQLELADMLARESDDYVRRNLGPFVVGDGLLRYYTRATLEHVRRWSKSTSETMRWNAAMVFASAYAARLAREAIAIVGPLAEDSSLAVRRAAAAAIRNLARRNPREIRRAVDRWARDPRRRETVRWALRKPNKRKA